MYPGTIWLVQIVQSKSKETHNTCVNNNGQTTSKHGLVVNSFSSLALDLQAVKSGSNPALTSGGMFLFTVNSNQPRSTNNQLVTDDQVPYLFSFEFSPIAI